MIPQQTNRAILIVSALATALVASLFLGCSAKSTGTTPMPAGHSPGMKMPVTPQPK